MSTNIKNDIVTAPLTITDAEPPFDNINARADIILRSSDLVDFHVLKAFLIFISPVFAGMFANRQLLHRRPEENKTGLPIIPMEEKCETLRNLLLFCYPGYSPVPEKLDDFLAVHASASRYRMEAVEERIQAALLSSTLMEQEPLRIFAIAVRHRWEVVARVAARNTLTVPVYGRPRIEELKFLRGLEYHRLLDYHWKCGEAARKLTDDLRWITRRDFIWNKYHNHKHNSQCSEVRDDTMGGGGGVWASTTRRSRWWVNYMKEAGANLALQPRGNTVTEPAIVNKAMEKAMDCVVCREKVIPDMNEFIATFATEVEKVISKIVLGIDF